MNTTLQNTLRAMDRGQDVDPFMRDKAIGAMFMRSTGEHADEGSDYEREDAEREAFENWHDAQPTPEPKPEPAKAKVTQTQKDLLKHQVVTAQGAIYTLLKGLEGRVPEERLKAINDASDALAAAISCQLIQELD